MSAACGASSKLLPDLNAIAAWFISAEGTSQLSSDKFTVHLALWSSFLRFNASGLQESVLRLRDHGALFFAVSQDVGAYDRV